MNTAGTSESEEHIVDVAPERLAAALAWMTPERLAALDALTDDDIRRQIAENPDAAPELDDEALSRARWIIPLKAAE